MLRRLLTWGTLCLALLLTGLTAPSYAAASADDDGLAVAARINHMSEAKLSRILANDPAAGLDPGGRLYYADPVQERPDVEATPLAAAYPYAQTFLLHSLPGANRTIFLDFDGHTVSGTGWNAGWSLAERFYPGLDADETPGFSDEEKDIVQEVWQRVAEDFAPLAIDVTTEDPGAAVLERANEADAVYGMRALVTSDAQAPAVLCSNGCQGIAFGSVFDEWLNHPGEWQPAWAFTSTAGNSASFLADIISHEVGHTLGLGHDGVAGGPPYYGGQGIWQPIMGAGFNPLGQFSNGEYGVANNHEDDFTVMNGFGAPMRTDDHGNTQAAATATDSFGPRSGVISTRADVDWFSFNQTCAGGSITVDVDPAATGPNLDAKLYVANPGGTIIGAIDPQSDPFSGTLAGLDASYSGSSLAAGTYRFGIDGVGQGLTTEYGYSDYGSRGAYTIDVDTSCSAPAVAPTVPTSVSVTTADNGTSAQLSWSPPLSDGGSAVTAYTVQRTGGTPVVLGPTVSSHGFTGLTVGTSYTFTVIAANVVGNSPTASATAKTPGPATAPQSLFTNSFSADSTELNWSAPTNDGGRAITGYVLARNGATPVVIAATEFEYTFTGLAAGTTYTLSVRAVTAFGQGTAATLSYTTSGPPSAPLNVSAVATSPSFVEVTWSLPASNGGFTILFFSVTMNGTTQTVPASNPRITMFGGLTPDTTYAVSVTASNSAGQGAAGTDSVHTPIATSAPGEVQSLTLIGATPTSATVSWAPPSDMGGLPLLRYEARLGSGAWVQLPTTARQRTFSGLAGNTHYSVSVRAVNDDGGGAFTPLDVLTDPPVKPTAPRIRTAAAGVAGGSVTAKAVWLAPLSNGGRAVTSYKVTALKMSSSGTVLRRFYKTVGPTVRNTSMVLPAGKYRFQLVAINSVGASPLSARSNLVTAR